MSNLLIGITAVVSIALMVGIAAIVVLRGVRRGTSSTNTPAVVSTPAQVLVPSTGASNFWTRFRTNVGRYMPLVIGLTIVIAGAFIYYLVGSGAYKGNGRSVDFGLITAAVILIGLAGYGLIKNKGGLATAIPLWVIVGGLLLFGGNSLDVWKKVQSDASSLVLEDRSSAEEVMVHKTIAPSAPVATTQRYEYGTQQFIRLAASEKSQGFRVIETECIHWWEEDESITTFTPEARSENGGPWISLDEFRKTGRSPGWIRFVATQDTNVYYKFTPSNPDHSCPK